MSPESSATGATVVRPFVPGQVALAEPVDPAARSLGFTSGYAAGYAEGVRRAAAAVADEHERLLAARRAEAARERAGLVDLLLALREAEVSRAEEARARAGEVVDVVARAVARLCRDVVLAAAPSAEAVRARLDRAVDEVGGSLAGTVTVRLAPASVRVLERAGVLPDGLPDGVLVRADERLVPGDVVVRSGAATVCDLVETALAAVDSLTAEPSATADASSDGTSDATSGASPVGPPRGTGAP